MSRTRLLLLELVESVVKGQPYSQVIGRTQEHAEQLMQTTIEMLEAQSFRVKRRGRTVIDAEGSWIHFNGVESISDASISGRRGFGYFVDHSVYDDDETRRPWMSGRIVDAFVRATLDVESRTLWSTGQLDPWGRPVPRLY